MTNSTAPTHDESSAAQTRMCEILDTCPPRPHHYGLWGLAAGGTLLDGMTLASIGLALPLIEKTYSMSPFMVGAVSAGSVVGMAIGALVGGPSSDRLGRRKMFLLSMSLIAVASAGSAIAWMPVLIMLSQFLIGCGQGCEFPNSSAYVSEIMPKSVRSRMLVATIAMQSVGMLVGVILAYLLLSARPEVDTWRYFLGARAIVAALIVALRFAVMPESPLWLMSQGRNAQAAKAIAGFAPQQHEAVEQLAPTAGEERLRSAEHADGKSPGLMILFSREYRRRTILTAGAWMLMDFSTYGVGHFSPSVLAALFAGEHHAGPIAAEFLSLKGSFALDGFLLLGFILGIWLVPRVGQIKMQSIGFLGMVAGMLILALAVGSGDTKSANMALVIAGFSVFNLMMNMGPNSTTFGMPALLFPPEIRATAAGFSAACAKTGATLGTLFLPVIGKSIGLGNTLALLAALSGFAFLLTAILGKGMLSGSRAADSAGDHAPD